MSRSIVETESLSSTNGHLGRRFGRPVIGEMPVCNGPGAMVVPIGSSPVLDVSIVARDCVAVARGLIVEPK
eukprot:5385030-Amphidinium_carterae.2